ncbi:hypothetical protein, partial [Sphingomonas sp. IW22]|uniref:hypothetical protein n=1 Tax=Sphingomonas sp. IW22 TaxID=3242489 RepID=UPI003521D350
TMSKSDKNRRTVYPVSGRPVRLAFGDQLSAPSRCAPSVKGHLWGESHPVNRFLELFAFFLKKALCAPETPLNRLV